MLMSPTLPGPARITPHGERMLEAIRNAGGQWVRRSQIAEALGKKRLTQWEIALLGALVNGGLIEAEQRPFSGLAGVQWVYRAKPE